MLSLIGFFSVFAESKVFLTLNNSPLLPGAKVTVTPKEMHSWNSEAEIVDMKS